MPTDFEHDLSELLHALTPQPPDDLAPPRVRALPEASRAGADAAVIELTPGTEDAPRRRRRWPAILAAASVAALAAGVVTLVQTGNLGHPLTHHSAGRPNVETVPQCRENQFVMEAGPPLARQGRSGTAHFSWDNRWAKRCAVSSRSVAITATTGAEPIGGWRFPVNTQSVQIPGHGRVIFTAHVRVTGRCQTVKDGGLRINVTHGATTASWSLGVTGCTLTPLRLTHRVIR
jgi:hypothetical protein